MGRTNISSNQASADMTVGSSKGKFKYFVGDNENNYLHISHGRYSSLYLNFSFQHTKYPTLIVVTTDPRLVHTEDPNDLSHDLLKNIPASTKTQSISIIATYEGRQKLENCFYIAILNKTWKFKS